MTYKEEMAMLRAMERHPEALDEIAKIYGLGKNVSKEENTPNEVKNNNTCEQVRFKIIYKKI